MNDITGSSEQLSTNEEKDSVVVKDRSVVYVDHFREVWINESETPQFTWYEKTDGFVDILNRGSPNEIVFKRKDLLKFFLEVRKKINRAIKNIIFSKHNVPITDLFK